MSTDLGSTAKATLSGLTNRDSSQRFSETPSTCQSLTSPLGSFSKALRKLFTHLKSIYWGPAMGQISHTHAHTRDIAMKKIDINPDIVSLHCSRRQNNKI
jgi:hypothetical protein